MKREKSPIFGEKTRQLQTTPIQATPKDGHDGHLNAVSDQSITANSNPTKINTNYQFTSTNIPFVTCHYHPDQQIRNFCKNPACLMPLCPACIPIHQEEHYQASTNPQFDLLENCLTEAYHALAQQSNHFVDDLDKVLNFQHSIENWPQIQKQKLDDAKQKCFSMIETFFQNLEKEINSNSQLNTDDLLSENFKLNSILCKKWEQVIKSLEKLNTDRCLKNLIKFYSKNVNTQINKTHDEIQQILLKNEASLQDVKVDHSQLYQMNMSLAKYVYQGSRKKESEQKGMVQSGQKQVQKQQLPPKMKQSPSPYPQPSAFNQNLVSPQFPHQNSASPGVKLMQHSPVMQQSPVMKQGQVIQLGPNVGQNNPFLSQQFNPAYPLLSQNFKPSSSMQGNSKSGVDLFQALPQTLKHIQKENISPPRVDFNFSPQIDLS